VLPAARRRSLSPAADTACAAGDGRGRYSAHRGRRPAPARRAAAHCVRWFSFWALPRDCNSLSPAAGLVTLTQNFGGDV